MYFCLFTIVVGTGLDINFFLLMGRACLRWSTCEPCGGLIGHPLASGQAQVGGQAGAQALGPGSGWGISSSYLIPQIYRVLSLCPGFLAYAIWWVLSSHHLLGNGFYFWGIPICMLKVFCVLT